MFQCLFDITGNMEISAVHHGPDDAPLLRGVSVFVFNDAGLIQDYEDFFDPDWITRHAD